MLQLWSVSIFTQWQCLLYPVSAIPAPPPPPPLTRKWGEIHWNYLKYTKTMVMPVHSPPCMVWLVDSRGPSCHRPWCSNSSPKWVVLTVLILLHCICVVSSTAPLQSVVPNCHDTTNTLRVQWVCSFADPIWIYVVQLLLWHLWQCCLRLCCVTVFLVCACSSYHMFTYPSHCVCLHDHGDITHTGIFFEYSFLYFTCFQSLYVFDKGCSISDVRRSNKGSSSLIYLQYSHSFKVFSSTFCFPFSFLFFPQSNLEEGGCIALT